MRNPRRADVLLAEADTAKARGRPDVERYLLDRARECLQRTGTPKVTQISR